MATTMTELAEQILNDPEKKQAYLKAVNDAFVEKMKPLMPQANASLQDAIRSAVMECAQKEGIEVEMDEEFQKGANKRMKELAPKLDASLRAACAPVFEGLL